MAKLFIANCTTQRWEFWYRLPGIKDARCVPIAEASQMQIGGELQSEEVGYIIENAERFGIINVDDVDRAKPYTGLCYSLGKPVPLSAIQKLVVHNQEILEKRAEENLTNTALANNDMLEKSISRLARDANQPMPDMQGLEMTLREETKGSPNKTEFYKDHEGNKAPGIRIAREGEKRGRGRPRKVVLNP